MDLARAQRPLPLYLQMVKAREQQREDPITWMALSWRSRLDEGNKTNPHFPFTAHKFPQLCVGSEAMVPCKPFSSSLITPHANITPTNIKSNFWRQLVPTTVTRLILFFILLLSYHLKQGHEPSMTRRKESWGQLRFFFGCFISQNNKDKTKKVKREG